MLNKEYYERKSKAGKVAYIVLGGIAPSMVSVTLQILVSPSLKSFYFVIGC